MKAYVLRAIGEFNLENVEKPIADKDEVIVAVRAAGVCGSDIPRIYYTGTYSYPLIPGHEFSGVVVEVGEGADTSWLGKRVGVFPLIPCKKCKPCKNKQYELCRKYNYLGSRTAGGFAEYVKVPAWNLIELPENVSFEQAAMLEPMAVASHALNRVKVSKDSTVAICGLGTIGLLLLMLLLEKGVQNVLLIGNKSFQKETILKMGVDKARYCDSKTSDVDSWIDNMTQGNGVDAFFDCVGRNEVVQLAVRHTALNGNVMLVGNPASEMTLDKQTYWKILRNQLTVMGTWNSSFTHEEMDDWHYCLKRLEQESLIPEMLISHKLPFDKLIDGAEIMRDKKEDYIKVMCVR